MSSEVSWPGRTKALSIPALPPPPRTSAFPRYGAVLYDGRVVSIYCINNPQCVRMCALFVLVSLSVLRQVPSTGLHRSRVPLTRLPVRGKVRVSFDSACGQRVLLFNFHSLTPHVICPSGHPQNDLLLSIHTRAIAHVIQSIAHQTAPINSIPRAK